MKKILSTVLGIFIAISLFIMPNMILAESAPPDVGINLTEDCLMWMGQNCFHYEKMMWIDDSQPDYTATSIAQDVVLSATYMVWTVLTIIIIYCWLWYIFSSASGSGKDTSKYKKWLIYWAIWAVLVRWAYTIIRLIQYVAKW